MGRHFMSPTLGQLELTKKPPMQTSPLIMHKPAALPPNKINHVTLVLDRSGSMSSHKSNVVKVTDNLVKFLAKRSQEIDQETRVTVYIFDNIIECLIYDKDVLRMPSIAGLYEPRNMTNLIGATLQAIEESKEIPQRYGDHSFLFYVITDGENNMSDHLALKLERAIQVAPENYTMACLVPDSTCARQAAKFGFPSDNIQQWDTGQSFEEVGEVITRSTESFFQARTRGIRGTKSLFSLDTSSLNSRSIRQNLLPLETRQYKIFPIKRDSPIRDFVEFYTKKPYVMGSAYYQLTKSEAVQNHKRVALRDRSTGAIYSGDSARDLLGLPDYEVKIAPASHPKYDIFIQSTSTNRKLIKGTQVLVLT